MISESDLYPRECYSIKILNPIIFYLILYNAGGLQREQILSPSPFFLTLPLDECYSTHAIPNAIAIEI